MSAVDAHAYSASGLGSPARGGFAVTPHDTNELPFVTTAVYVGSTGALKLKTVNGDTVAFAVVPAGTTIPIRAKLIFDTDTDAGSIVGLY